MKKPLLLFFWLLILILSFATQGIAGDTQPKPTIFGVGASIEEISEGVYKMVTTGKKVAEGFVHTPDILAGDKKWRYQVDLKGTGNVYLKIEETDARGRFLKERKSNPIQLFDDWNTYHLDLECSTDSSQIDVFVLTSSAAETKVYFKNLQLMDR